MRSLLVVILFVSLVLFGSGCGTLKVASKGAAKSARVAVGTLSLGAKALKYPFSVFKRKDGTYVGIASWYGDDYHGKRTANGEIYNQYKLTAAHRTLPFNTLVRVTNLKNGRSVVVRINDRGPFIRGRIIDLSYAAAGEIGMVDDGIQKVELRILQ
jgi:rare lipoprotein A